MKAQYKSREWHVARVSLALCAIVLISLTSFLAAVHVHPSGVPNHACSICALTHSGVAPAEFASTLPALLSSVFAPASPQDPHTLLLVSTQFIRPPPLG